MEHKALADVAFKADATGALTATFSTFGQRDRDGDVLVQSAFTDGQRVPLCQSHNWDKVIGDGIVKVLPDRAVFDGKLWLDTFDGEQAYRKIKNAGPLQEYSYGFQILDSSQGTQDGEPVRLVKSIELFEVSSVLKGASIGTHTDRIKEAALVLDEKPFANEHACRLADPGRFDRFRRANNDRQHDGKPIDVIYAHPKAGGGWEQQALRFPTSSWDAAAARSYCSGHSGSFEAASGKDALEQLQDAVLELKVGRRFSAASRREIQTAIDALAQLIRDVEQDDGDDPALDLPAIRSLPAEGIAHITPAWLDQLRVRYRLRGE